MTVEQYNLIVQHAADLRSALYAYEDAYGSFDLKNDNISEIVVPAANLIRIVDSLEPIYSPQDDVLF